MAESASGQFPIVLSSVYSTGVRVYHANSVTRSGAQAPIRIIDSPMGIDRPVPAEGIEVTHHIHQTLDTPR